MIPRSTTLDSLVEGRAFGRSPGTIHGTTHGTIHGAPGTIHSGTPGTIHAGAQGTIHGGTIHGGITISPASDALESVRLQVVGA